MTRLTCMLFALIWASTPPSPFAAEADLKAQFLAEALPAYENARAVIMTLACTMHERVTRNFPDNPSTNRTRTIEFVLKGPLIKFETTGTGGQNASVANRDAIFKLHRSKDADNYYVGEYQDVKAASRPDDINAKFYLMFPLTSQYIGARSINLLVASPEYEFQSAERDTENERLVRLKFRTVSSPEFSYSAVVDPGRNWAVLNWTMTTPNMTERMINEYNDEVTEFPFPKKIVDTMTMPDGFVPQIMEYEFDRPTKCDAPDSAFTLTHYGIPEVARGATLASKSTYSRWVLIAVNIGVILAFVAGIYLVRRSKRRASGA